MRQASLVLDVDKNRADALILHARALAKSGKSPTDSAAGQRDAIQQLQAAIKANPRFEEAYHVLADIYRDRKDRSRAITVLKDDLKANPSDATAVASLVDILAQSNTGDRRSRRWPTSMTPNASPRKSPLVTRRARWSSRLRSVSIARGSLTWRCRYAEVAAAKLNTPAAHLNYGDLLLTIAERENASAKAEAAFQKAVEQYDLVLKISPTRSRPSTTRRGSSTRIYGRLSKPWTWQSPSRSG